MSIRIRMKIHIIPLFWSRIGFRLVDAQRIFSESFLPFSYWVARIKIIYFTSCPANSWKCDSQKLSLKTTNLILERTETFCCCNEITTIIPIDQRILFLSPNFLFVMIVSFFSLFQPKNIFSSVLWRRSSHKHFEWKNVNS